MSVTVSDHLVEHPQGRLFARSWEPPGAAGTTVVLFHESLGCSALWRDFPALLAGHTGRRVVSYDRLGFGRSDPHPGRLAPDFMADEARTFLPTVLQALAVEDFVGFGHSVGGEMALHAAARFGERCRAVVSESAQAFVEDLTLRGVRAAQVAFADPVQAARLHRHHGEKTQWVLSAWFDTWLDPAFADWSLEELRGQVACPLLVLHGIHDEFGSRAHPELIASLSTGSAEMALLDAGHVPHRELPDEVLTRVAMFLARQP